MLRARAEQARLRARALAAQTLELRSNAGQSSHDTEAIVDVAKELRDCLKESVSRHARLARCLDEPPEQTIVRIKEAAREALAVARTKVPSIDPLEARVLHEQLVRWTVDAYFSAGPLSS